MTQATVSDDNESALFSAAERVAVLCCLLGEFQQEAEQAMRTYTTLFTVTQLGRVADELWADNQFGAARAVREKAAQTRASMAS